MIERKFIERGKRNLKIGEYLKSQLDNADFSHVEIHRTPLNTRITVYAGRPGMVIGRAGSKIQEMTEKLKTEYGIDNPLLEVKDVENPYLDASVVVKQIVSALERRVAYRRIVNIMMKEVMNAGAIGVEMVVGGKLGGAMARTERFSAGYLKKCGAPAVECTDKAQAQATLKAGVIGVKVTIMKSKPDILEMAQKLGDLKKKTLEAALAIATAPSAEASKDEKVEIEVADDAKKPKAKKTPAKKKDAKAEEKAEGATAEEKSE